MPIASFLHTPATAAVQSHTPAIQPLAPAVIQSHTSSHQTLPNPSLAPAASQPAPRSILLASLPAPEPAPEPQPLAGRPAIDRAPDAREVINGPLPLAFIQNSARWGAPHDCGPMTYECRFCFTRFWMKERVKASPMRDPRFERCCKQGRVRLPAFREPPQFLQDLLRTAQFGEKTRQYNSALAFASFMAKDDNRLGNANGRNWFSYNIQGQAYTRQGLMEGPPNAHTQGPHHPMYAQLYLYDAEEATAERIRAHRNLDPNVLRRLDETNRDISPSVRAYQTAREVLQSQPDPDNTQIRINHNHNVHLLPGSNNNVANLPTTDEVAALLPQNVDRDGPLGIRVFLRAPADVGHGATIVPSSHPHHWAMCYLLLFPYGDAWHSSLRLDTFPQPLNHHQPDADDDDVDADGQPGPAHDGEGDSDMEEENPDREERRLARRRHRTRLTERVFWSFHLQDRRRVRIYDDPEQSEPYNNFLLCEHRLFHQLLVHIWSSLLSNRLDYLREHNSLFRRDCRAGVLDVMATDPAVQQGDLTGNNVGRDTGRPAVLPSSFTGGDRYLNQMYHNAMTCVTDFTCPTFFITLTANTNWPEIRNALGPGETVRDRLDLVDRVFALKLDALLDDLVHKQVLGPCHARASSIEYQKRGNIHCHIVLWTANGHELGYPEYIDSVVSAEVPHPKRDPRLCSLVSTYMMHEPCDRNDNAPCIRHGNQGRKRCRYGYPQEAREQTTITPLNGYPLYRRRCRFEVEIDGRGLGDQWVASYNAYLLRKYDGHINIEVCANPNVIQYIIKYINKGQGIEVVGVGDGDETSAYQSSVYIAPHDAFWRIQARRIHVQRPYVYRLGFH